MTFGQKIAEARKGANLTQKELAIRIIKEEDGKAISPQYLNDIEHDRRNPPTALIGQFARELGVAEDVLYFLAGKMPSDLRRVSKDDRTVGEAFKAFRKALK